MLKRPKVIFATLGRFIEVLTEKEWLSLSNLRIMIIDEADKMVNKLRHEQHTKS